MFINGVKITIILCVTIMVSCILFISYSEYVNKYIIVSTPDNSIYIFDKKTHSLNKCNDSECKKIDTKLPDNGGIGITDQIITSPSKMFGTSEKSMPEETSKTEAKPVNNKESIKQGGKTITVKPKTDQPVGK